jgi:hypothetical protein
MKLTKKWLEEKTACAEGIVWFAAQKETDGLAVVKKLISEDKLKYGIKLMEGK